MRLPIRLLPLFCAAPIALFQFFLLLPLIGLSPIGGSSEAREAHIANIVLQYGEWLLPLRDGLLPSKPPLFHWIAAWAGTFTGQVTPFTARLISLVFASGVIFLSAWMTLLVCEFGPSGLRRDKKSVALGAALILATTFGFQNMSGDARVDMTYCFFVCLALFPILTAGGGSNGLSPAELKKSWRWNLFYCSMGFGVLAKGPIAVVLPCLIVFFVLWSAFGWREAIQLVLRPQLGWIAFLLIALPWYLLASRSGGDGFVDRQIVFENLRRFTGGEAVNSQPPWYYIPEFLRTALPWSILFCVAVPEVLSFLRSTHAREESHSGARALRQSFAVWFWAGFVFLSIASGKRQSYLLPLFPGMAIFLALRAHQYVSEMSDQARGRLRSAARSSHVALVLMLLLVAGCFDVLRFPISSRGTLFDEVRLFLAPSALRIECLLVGLAALVVLSAYLQKASFYARMMSVYAAVLGLTAILIYSGLAVKNFMKGFDRAAPQILAAVPAGAALVVLRQPREEFFDPLLYYLSREVALKPWQEAQGSCPAFVVARHADFENLKQSSKEFVELRRFNSLDRAYAGKIDQEYVLARCG